MNKRIYLIFILFGSILYGQEKVIENFKLTFFDECSNSVIIPEYEILIDSISKGIISVNYFIDRDEWVSQGFESIPIDQIKDTIRIPKILFSSGNELHTQKWKYFNCNTECNGIEKDYYKNGKLRLEGKFVNGKPHYIKYFNLNGIIETQEIYTTETLKLERINYYDINGDLSEYEIHKRKKKKEIVKTYDKNGKLLSKECERIYMLQTNEKKLTCKDFKTGDFYTQAIDNDKIVSIVDRSLNSQIEYPEGNMNKPIYEIIKWIDDCNYRLTFDESKMELDKDQKMGNYFNGILVTKIRIEGKCLYYKATLNAGEKEFVQYSKICKK